MDDGFVIPKTNLRFGLDPVLGLLLPGVGDAAGAVSTLALFALAFSRGAPYVVLLRMALNVGIDTLLGAVPLIGDAFDFGWKANRRNLALLERALQNEARPRTFGDYVFVSAVLLFVLGALTLPVVLTFLALRALWRA